MAAERALVVGMGVTNAAVAAALVRHGIAVVAADDHPSPAARARAQSLGVELREEVDVDGWTDLLAGCTMLLPAPGIPDHHPVFAAARSAHVPVHSEFDLARRWDERPLLAITGTDGKTTVTTLVTAMLEASGVHALAVGNTEVPLVAAIDDPAVEVFVVEASSFRLGHSRRFEPAVATWLNLADDHLDAHASRAAYIAAKARIWSDLGPSQGVAVANADDPVVMANRNPAVRTLTFGLGGPGAADYTVSDGTLVTPAGEVLVRVADLPRALPHDLSNALAAAATALAGGATVTGVRDALLAFRGLPHRVELVAEADGVRWFDDSKATAPHATLAAIGGFESVVLIAGGRNKGLDLSVLGAAAPRVRAVVGIGDAGPDVLAAFADRPGVLADSMDDAVRAAAGLAEAGDVVLLSPGCASFDWYRSYGERGDDFVARVRARVLGEGAA
jgi:UDP-N-acetylmuramoylalanine--D-glutamate ligase